ncbi:hypothetical protein FOBRF1_003118 [Fusarium oxysporum]
MENAYFDAITSEGKYKTSIEALKNNLLPAYKDTHFAYDSDTPEASRQEICNFLQGPDSEQPNISKHYLVHKYGTSLGEAWAALAAVTAYKKHLGTGGNAASSGSDQDTSRPKRVRRSTVHAKYGPFGEQTFGSSPANKTSSPANPPSSLEQVEAVPAQDFPSEYNSPFLSKPVVDFRDKRQRMSLETTGLNGQIIAIDDGGLTLKPDEDNGAFPDPDVTVALVQAKRCLKVDGGSPMISDECLAQMVYAAIMARDRDRTVQPVNTSITITNTTQHYICFFQFDMKDDYLDDLKEGDVPTQQLTATVTKWFDLSQKKRRTAVLKNVYSLIDLAKEKPVLDFGED